MLPLIVIKNLMPYIPEDMGDAPDGAIFLKSDDGADWYQAIIHFSPDTLKIMFDRNNFIVDANMDVELLWPYGLSVAEISPDTVPEEFTRPDQDSMGKWLYQDGAIVLTPGYEAGKAKAKKRQLIAAAITAIASIQLKLQAGRTLSEDESAKLNAVLDYIADVENTGITNAPGISWPKLPLIITNE